MAMQSKTEERAAAGMPQMNGQALGAMVQQQQQMMQESIAKEMAMVLAGVQQYFTPAAELLQFVQRNMQPNDSEFYAIETVIVEIEEGD